MKSQYGFGIQDYECHGIERYRDIITDTKLRLDCYTSKDYPKPIIWEGDLTSLGDIEEDFAFNDRQNTFNLITMLHQNANYNDEVSMYGERDVLLNAYVLLNDRGAYAVSYYTNEADVFNRYGMEDILIESGFAKVTSDRETILLGTKMELGKAIMLNVDFMPTDAMLDKAKELQHYL